MDLIHETWFWVLIIAGPIAVVVATLARLAKREPPPDLPPSVHALGFPEDEEDDEWGEPSKNNSRGKPEH